METHTHKKTQLEKAFWTKGQMLDVTQHLNSNYTTKP
jgi:hypothetical protein